MAELESTSVETPEVAEPEVEVTGAEEPEPAEPVSEGKTDADARFAQMRRENEAKETELAEVKAELARLQARQSAIDSFTNEHDFDEIEALAQMSGYSRDDIEAKLSKEEESQGKDIEISNLKKELEDIRIEQRMREDLILLQKVDPSIDSLEDLGEDYANYIAAGLSAKEAYGAINFLKGLEEATPPKEIGKVKAEPAQKDYYTEAEVAKMSPEEKQANWEKIFNSFSKWK